MNARLRRWACSPGDLLRPIRNDDHDGEATMGGGDEDDDRDCAEGRLCPHGCGGRYSGRPVQSSQVAPIAAAAASSAGDSTTIITSTIRLR